LDFEEIRHYRVGDDIRNIDWKVTNRTGKPHVRVYNEERERPVLLLVDQRSSMFFGSQVKMKSVIAAELAALAAWRVLDVSDRLGGIVFGDEEIVSVRPERSQRNVMRLLGEIARMNNILGQAFNPSSAQLNKVLRKAEEVCTHDYLILLISDFLGWDHESVRHIKRLSRHNDLIAGLAFDPLEKDLPKTQSLVVSDGQQQVEVKPGKKGLAEDYRLSFESSISDIENELNRYHIPVISIQTADPVEVQVRQALGKLEAMK
jgi:uncharacterized protein (DUF58 family)